MKEVMRNRSIVGVLAAVGLITAFAARPSGAASTRTKMTCEAYRADAKSLRMDFKAGDWGTTPEPLRVLPPKASFCGSWNVSTAIASPLTGKAITAYYTPILEKMGCKAVRMRDQREEDVLQLPGQGRLRQDRN